VIVPSPLPAPLRHAPCSPPVGLGRHRLSGGCQVCGPRLSGRGPRL